MLVKLRAVCQTIEFVEYFLQKPVTGSRIASNMLYACSRATAYRWIKKAENAGLITKISTSKSYMWSLTPKGMEFLGAWHELPF